MNVVVIVANSLRVDHLGCYGNEWIETPNLDALAKESAVFFNAYAEGLPTIPARAAFWTGRYTFPFRGWQPFQPDDMLLAEVLWDKGYRSALITDVYHMHAPGMNCCRGFDFVKWIRGQGYDPYRIDPDIEVDVDKYYKPDAINDEIFKPRFMQYLKNVHGREGEEDYFTAQVMQAGIDWLRENAGHDRLFLWLDVFDPHEPWDPPPAYHAKYKPADYDGKDILDPVPGMVEGYLSEDELANVRSLYAGEVTFVDAWVGRVMAALKELKLLENTMVVFTSDYGEPLGYHGLIRKCRPALYDDLVYVPLLVRLPDGTGAGSEIDAVSQSCDLMPTILGALDIEGPPGMTGANLMPIIRGEQSSVRDYAYSGFHRRAWSIRSHDYTYIVSLDGSEPPQLLDRNEDPAKRKNIAEKNPDVVRELDQELRRFVDELRQKMVAEASGSEAATEE